MEIYLTNKYSILLFFFTSAAFVLSTFVPKHIKDLLCRIAEAICGELYLIQHFIFKGSTYVKRERGI